MPKFGTIHFGREYFGAKPRRLILFKQSWLGIPLGITVRRQIGKRIIFRRRRGNGYFGSLLNKIYQDKYRYIVPGNINNPEGEPAREALATAVSNWKNVLTAEEKAEFNKRARRKKGLTGFALYVGEYIKVTV